MRGTVAKRIRREVYGDNSIKIREYDEGLAKAKSYRYFPKIGKYATRVAHVFRKITGTLKSTGFREEYQKRKREYGKEKKEA